LYVFTYCLGSNAFVTGVDVTVTVVSRDTGGLFRLGVCGWGRGCVGVVLCELPVDAEDLADGVDEADVVVSVSTAPSLVAEDDRDDCDAADGDITSVEVSEVEVEGEDVMTSVARAAGMGDEVMIFFGTVCT
jgi:hypothetical protein